MDALIYLAPMSVLLGLLGLFGFFWTFRSGQYEDPKGAAERILLDHLEDGPPQRPSERSTDD